MGGVVEIIAEIDRDGIWGNTSCRSIPALVAWRPAAHQRTRSRSPPAHRLAEFHGCAEGMRRPVVAGSGRCHRWKRAGQGLGRALCNAGLRCHGQPTAPAVKAQTTTRPERRPEISARSPTPTRKHLLADQTSPTMRRRVRAALSSHRDALINEWKRDRHPRGRRRSPSRRCPAPSGQRSCVWSRRAGTPRSPVGRTGSTTVLVHLNVAARAPRVAPGSGAHRLRESVSDVRCHLRGVDSNARAADRMRPGRPGRSAGGFAAPSSTATGPAWCPGCGAARQAARPSHRAGKTAARPS